MPQHHLQAPGVAPVSQVIDRKRMSESMHVRLNYSLALCIKPPPHGNLLDLSKERRIFELRRSFVLSGRRDLNPGPHGPEPCALAGLSYAPHGEIITDLLPLGKKTNRLEIIGHGFDRITGSIKRLSLIVGTNRYNNKELKLPSVILSTP